MNQQSYIFLYILWQNSLPLVQRETHRQWKRSFGSPNDWPKIMGQVVCTLAIKALALFLRQLWALILCKFCEQPSIGWSRKRKNSLCFQAFSVRKLHLLVAFPVQIKGWILPYSIKPGGRKGCAFGRSWRSPLLHSITCILHDATKRQTAKGWEEWINKQACSPRLVQEFFLSYDWKFFVVLSASGLK